MMKNMTEKSQQQARSTKFVDREKKESKDIRRTKLSEYGKQLYEKQRLKHMYGLRERQFRRFFQIALKAFEGTPGDNLLNMLERRLDNVVYRLKMAISRAQARQIIVHGHVLVNGKKVSSPSYLVSVNDTIALDNAVEKKEAFLDQVVDKRMKMGIKVPEWLELNKQERKGIVLRDPVRADIQVPIEEHLIVELYSK
ncbi:MAG TPA: 30S ribosomal protein S4 [Candidatus Dependentiae bacterium]|nr:30S ribosomal protein S4 [Candidatus Dependentiae bacterium]HRQ62324.1 30S ribosomal protein S4 [Candidatus Dependentiae bacterium]